MGVFSKNNTPRLLQWLCFTIIVCCCLLGTCSQVSADSKVDNDLVFDAFETSNTDDNHPRIRKEISEDVETHLNLPLVEEEAEEGEGDYWLSNTVSRIKRSIKNIFSKDEHKKHKKAIAHHKKAGINQHKKLKKSKRADHHQHTKIRKHRQLGQEDYGQQEEDEYEDDVTQGNDDADDYADEYDEEYESLQTAEDNNVGAIQLGPRTDDEDLGDHSGSGETDGTPSEPPVPSPNQPNVFNGLPRVYRFAITIGEPYNTDFNDRNSNAFQEMSQRLKRSIESLYENLPGAQTATVISIEPVEQDHFRIRVTADIVDENAALQTDQVRRAIYEPVESTHRIGEFTALPDQFYFREFGESHPSCEPYQIQCRSGQCISADLLCNGIRDCNDNTDEEGCVTVPPETSTTTTTTTAPTTTIITTTPTTTTTEEIVTVHLLPDVRVEPDVEGSGDVDIPVARNKCRGDDSVECSDGSASICAVQVCDGTPDCDDGGDELNCLHPECSVDEFKCDVSRCIPKNQICDGKPDCSDGTDEHNCKLVCTPEEISCDEKCVTKDQTCDGVPDCSDGQDERNCPATQQCNVNQFDCRNGECIDKSQRCDGYGDCSNGIDENNCITECPQDSVLCNDGKCVPGKKCDSIYDCLDDSDELNCTGHCHITEFQCTSNGACIDERKRCDYLEDCLDGSDEKDCDTCDYDEFQCFDGSCIPAKNRCNGNSDCDDNSDEEGCTPTVSCSSNQLRCDDGNTCYELYQQCDGTPNCRDGSDERDCPCRSDQFQCAADNSCIDINLRCNQRNDCRDGSDEYNCPTFAPTSTEPPVLPESCPRDYQRCRTSTQCIRREQICDGTVDCSDLSDESGCPTTNVLDLKTYPDSQEQRERQEVVFQCRDEGSARARVHWERENGRPLPPGTRDERGRLEMPNIQLDHAGTYICVATDYPRNTLGAQVSVTLRVVKRPPRPTLPPTACGLYEATCSNGDCIPKNKVCDGNYDCIDGSDESRCNPNGCEPNEFQCSNRKCVLKTWRCDSDDDCGDGSDEANCATNPPGSLCAYHQFACHSNNQCIPRSYHCDMERDCVDGSDEIGCSKPVISKPPPPMVNLNVGETFEITCTAVGIPTPEIVWRRNWGHIPSKCRTTSENGFGRLICENIQDEDQGAYSCESINIKGATFAVPDTILVTKKDRVCPVGYFNNDARTENECIKCFCFGQTSECRSADLFIFQFQPPFDSLKLLGVHVDPSTGVIDIRDEPIFRGAQPVLQQNGPKGVYASVPEYSPLSQPNVVPYFAMPENYHHNQLKSYGGFLRYTVRHSNRNYPLPGPNVIISGNGYTLLHQSTHSPAPNTNENMEVRFFEGDWVRKSPGAPESIATREEIMMVLEDIQNILIKVQYNEGILNTSIYNIEMDSAATPDSGLGAAVYVEQCSCPVGYRGSSCEECDSGYTRQESGPWLGKCYKDIVCPPGQYFDGRECQVCPCPHTTAPNQFATTCQLGPDGDVICNCPHQYVGRRCEHCAPGYEGNPLVRGDYCKPIAVRPYCDVNGSLDIQPDANGRCRCKELVDGPTCSQCKANTFHLSGRNQFGCIPCFCMGVSQQCSSSNWYRDQVSNIFTSSTSNFKIVDNINRETLLVPRLNQENKEISYSSFSSPNAYYWSLPSRYLGDKITSYGGFLRYTLKHTPVPGGQSSRNSAADVELVSKNNINLLHFNQNQTQPTSAPQSLSVPLLEQYWQRSDGQQADREHLLMVLADLEAIYIKATYYTNPRESSLISVSLDIANERNTGSFERALEVEQCKCPVGYVGLSCEDCDIGYYRTPNGIYLGLCEPCECNGHSNECDPDTGVCMNCRDFTTGENCGECLPGYTGNPRYGQACAPAGITPPPCECDQRGSISSECINNRCNCKVNVEGNYCNRCRTGTFGLNVSNIEGCETCFCSGVASECSESNLFIEQIPIQIIPDDHGFTLTDQSQRTRISERFDVDMFLNQISYQVPDQRETLYWSLPNVFTGNKVKSYGGKLEFTQKYSSSGRYFPDRDILIIGNGITLYWSNPSELIPDRPNMVSVQLHPSSGWMRLDDNRGPRPASREDFLITLANIDSILIRATVAQSTIVTYLSDITLDTAVDTYTTQPRATNVEICRCPAGYRGSSCEACASGYYKDLFYEQSRPLGSCTKCPCNDRETSCEMGNDRRVVCHCQPNYSGPSCEIEAGIDYTTPYPNPEPSPTPKPKPTIEVTIEDQNIGIYEVGHTVRYNCSARSQLAPRTVRVKWSKSSGQLPNRAIDDGRGLLVITDLKVTDSGRYICEASDGYTIVTSSVDLTVGVRNDERPRVVISQPYIEVNENQPIELTCAATGIPTPDLTIVRLDGQPLNPLIDVVGGNFRMARAQVSDSGEYECIASNRAGSEYARFRIVVRQSVEDIVKVEIEPAYYTGTSGERVLLRCISSSPSQTTRWSKEGGRLPYDSREDRGMLIINNSQPEDSGVYVCSVTSVSGNTGTSRVTVSIQQGENQQKYPEVKVSPERISISQGQSTEIQCTATGYPAPTVKWTKLGEELRRNIEQIGSTLYIRNANVEDRGIYVCVATNQNGIEQASVIVEVTRLEMPQLEIHPQQSQTVVAGQSAILQCRAIAGIPSPTIVWRRENGLPLGSRIEEMTSGTLRFIDISRNEEGKYICTATNEAGTTTATASIIVHTQPEIFITPERDYITKNVGDSLRLECRGSGIPQPNVYWTKYDTTTYQAVAPLASQSVAIQQFDRLTTAAAGLYICRAESDAGSTEKRVQLVVESFPTRGDITGEDATGGRRPDWRANEPPPTSNPNIPKYDEVYTAGVGSRAEIKCRIGLQDQNIQVKWIRADNSSLPQQAYERSGTLYIDQVQPYAEGEYRCLGLNEQGQVLFQLNTYLKVLSPPRITLIPPKQVVHPGQNAFINCTTTGEQPVTIEWLPIGRNMPSSVYTRDGYIRFNNIQLQDAGRYLCRARNNAGEAEGTADVIVEENFSNPPIQAEQKRQVAPIGTLVTLRCKAGNEGESNSIRWFRDNSPAYVYGETFRIPNVQKSDEGRYYCEISTKEGTSSDYIDLELIGPDSRQPDRQPEPTLYISPPEIEHRPGENIDINCQSNERGVITSWSRPSSRLPNNAQNVGGTLRFINLRPDNAGYYRCEATGSRGVYHKDYNLQVIADEVRDQPPLQIKVAPKGASVRLECNTNLEEPITYLWTKQGGMLPSNTDVYSKTITLNNVGSMDAATYTCSASSSVTNIDVPIILVVTGIVPYFTQAPNSYITLPTLGDSYMQFSFEISFKPETDGLILYNGNKGNDRTGDFISLALVNGIPEFKFNLGHSTATVKADRPISNREWHTVKIVRNKKKVTMYVDGNGPFIGFADGKYIGLDLTENLYLGGVPNSNNISPDVFPYSPYVGFVGCIGRFKIGHAHLDILSEALNKTGTTTCETCSGNKCENQGACQEALSKEGYTCICPSGFSGPTCNKLKGEACSPYACGVGRCIDTDNSFECQCPLGRAGRRCEREITVNEPAFQNKNGAFIAYPPLKPARRLKFTMKIKPVGIEDGILMYSSETEEGHGDFISLAIHDKHLEFRFDAGNGVTVIRHEDELIPDEWHIVTATRSLSDGRLTVDAKTSTGRLAGNHKTLNLHTPLYIGGYDKHLIKVNEGVQVASGFDGCISDINVAGVDLNMILNATDASNVENCNTESEMDNTITRGDQGSQTGSVSYNNRQTGCSSSPCLNNGQCYPLTPTDYKCSCLPGFAGRNCETSQDICEQRPCQNQGICKGNYTHYQCDCVLGYTGVNCDQRIELHNDAHFEGNGFLEFNRDLLDHSDQTRQEIIAFELSTNSSDGLIFWHGQTPEQDGIGQDFIALAVENGYLEFSFDLGNGPAIIRNLHKRIDDGEQHTVVLKREGRLGSIEIDNTWIEEGEAEGYTTEMNTYGNIYIGGTPNISSMTGGRFSKGFRGCIHGFEVQNSDRLDLGIKAINGLNIKPCSSSLEPFNIIS